MSMVIEVEGLSKRYGTRLAVDDVGFTVTEGEIFGILGVNGAGKTTTVECLQGLRRPDRAGNAVPLTHVVRAIQEPWLDLGNPTGHVAVLTGLAALATAVWLTLSTRTAE
jgi:ABC-type Na+ transport system ATPase subunit NatA